MLRPQQNATALAARRVSAALALALAAFGCGDGAPSNGGDSDAGGGECTEEPCLDAPARGFQVRSIGTEISPGEDVEYCEIARLPGDASDAYHVTRFESAMTPGSHHLIVAAVPPESSAGLIVGERYRCIGPSLPGGTADLASVTGSQLPYYSHSFPEGVGRQFEGGQFVVFNYHYLNGTDDPVHARQAVNFHLTDEAAIDHLVADLGFFNFAINIPAGETRSFSKTCLLSNDAMVFKLTRHTHQWGTDFPVHYAGGDRDGQLIFTSPNYEDPDFVFDEPTLVRAGEGFSWTCNYHNTTESTLRFGVQATDEMCILFGHIYHPTDRTMSDQGCF
jgi:hypothetical protein